MSQSNSFSKSTIRVRDVKGVYRVISRISVLDAAQTILEERLVGLEPMESPREVREYLQVKLGALEHEVFAVLMLDSQNRIIRYQELFRGTVSQTSVYPREVVKEALALNAAAMILVHNHPSGVAEPSRADEALTQSLKAALRLVDVIVLDHLIVAGTSIMSFAEKGLL